MKLHSFIIILGICLLQLKYNAIAQTDAPILKFYTKNLKGSKIYLIQFIDQTTQTVDSVEITKDNEHIVLTGKPIEEEERFQVHIDKRYSFNPVLENNRIVELYFDPTDIGKMDNLKTYIFKNSQSSIDWNNAMFYPAKWKKRRNDLLQEQEVISSKTIEKERDSLSKLIRDYYVDILSKTESAATADLTLHLLGWEDTTLPYTELTNSLSLRFANSKNTMRVLDWFIIKQNNP